MRRVLCSLIGVFALATPVYAEEQNPADAPVAVVSAGVFGLRGDGREGDVMVGAEYRFGGIAYGLEPMVGVANVDARSDHWFAYAGLNWNLWLGKRWLVAPSLAVASYHNGDDGKDLGGALEFRSGIELSYVFENNARLGGQLTHLSNAGIHEDNDGVETLSLVFAYPTGGLFR